MLYWLQHLTILLSTSTNYLIYITSCGCDIVILRTLIFRIIVHMHCIFFSRFEKGNVLLKSKKLYLLLQRLKWLKICNVIICSMSKWYKGVLTTRFLSLKSVILPIVLLLVHLRLDGLFEITSFKWISFRN